MNWYKLANMDYFLHGSDTFLSIGTILYPDPDWFKGFGANNWDNILTKYKSPQFLPRHNVVYMVDGKDKEGVDVILGDQYKYIYQVKPIGKIEKHDINWISEIETLISEKSSEDKIKEAALNYWNGVPHYNEQLWEYVSINAKIIRLVEQL